MPTKTQRSGRTSGRSRSRPSGTTSRSSETSHTLSYTDVLDSAREHPLAAAAAAGAVGALAAGSIFLWSRRDQIGDQFNDLIEAWRGEEQPEPEIAGAETATSRSTPRRSGMSETGGGNASLGRRTGGGGVRSTASGRGRAKAVRTSAMS